MKKLLVVVLVGMFLMPLGAVQVFAADETAQAGIVDVGNKMCPVMGGPVNGKDFVEYNGKRYGLCCPGCKRTFLSDPAKYIAKVNAEKTADASASKEMERGMEQGSL